MPLNPFVQRQRKISFFRAVSYRAPLPVTEVEVFPGGDGYAVCPRCESLLDREYIHYCYCCGQCLTWELFDHAQIIPWPRQK